MVSTEEFTEPLDRGEERYRLLLDHIRSLVSETDEEGKYLYLSPSCRGLLGYEPSDLIGRLASELLHPEDLSRAVEKYGLIQKPGTTTVDEWRFRHANGTWRWLECSATVYRGSGGELKTIVIANDVTQRRMIEEAQAFLAQRSWNKSGEEFFRSLVRFLSGHLAADYARIERLVEAGPGGRATALAILDDGTGSGAELVEARRPELLAKPSFCDPEGLAGIALASSEGKAIGYVFIHSAAAFQDPDLVMKILHLVSGRASGELERREGEAALRRSLAQRETLMKELQHRVKNNLNIVASMLSLESRGLKDEASKSLFLDAQARIQSMSAIYERLYLSEDLVHVPMDQYVRDLASSIFSTYTIDPGRIRLECSLGRLDLDTKRAIPLGLMLNELLTNSIKYAFPCEAAGRVSVLLEATNGRARLEVSDDGAGFEAARLAPGRGLAEGGGMGLVLTRSLADQLDAGFSIESSPGSGTRASIEFPLDPP